MKKHLLFALMFGCTFSSYAEVSISPVRSISDINGTPPANNHYRLHLFDVGTGLSILAQRHTWDLLFNAGIGDDKSGNQTSRGIPNGERHYYEEIEGTAVRSWYYSLMSV